MILYREGKWEWFGATFPSNAIWMEFLHGTVFDPGAELAVREHSGEVAAKYGATVLGTDLGHADRWAAALFILWTGRSKPVD